MVAGPQRVLSLFLVLDIDITEEERFLNKAGANPSQSLTHPPEFWSCNWSDCRKEREKLLKKKERKTLDSIFKSVIEYSLGLSAL